MPASVIESYSLEGNLFTEVLEEVFKLHSRLLVEEERLVHPFGLTSARWKVISLIFRSVQPLTIPQIGRRIGLSRQNIQRLADLMDDEGIVEYRNNPDHRRAKLVHLTKKGLRLYRAVKSVHIPWANHCAKGLKRADLDRTLKNVQKLLIQVARAQ